MPADMLTRDMKVHFLLKLLTMRGQAGEMQLRLYADSGKCLKVRGQEFDIASMKEALVRWALLGATAKPMAPALPAPTPPGPPPAPPAARPAPAAACQRRTSGGGAPAPSPRRPTPLPRRPVASPQKPGPLPRRHAAADLGDPGPAASRLKRKSGDLATDGKAAPEIPAAPQPPPPSRRPSLRVPTPSPEADRAVRPRTARPRAAAAAPPARSASSEAVGPGPTSAGDPASAAGELPEATGLPKAAGEMTVRELKAQLGASSVDCAGCVEKADLQALWSRYEFLRGRPLQELRASCAAADGPRFATVEECARFLVAPPPAASAPTALAPSTGGGAEAEEAAAAPREREREALKEVSRILPLRRESFSTALAWGFAVLGVTVRDTSAVQKGYRALMKVLHPDRAGSAPGVSKAVEVIREAKEVCERGLSNQEPPGAPRNLTYSVICATPGQRKFRLQWVPPETKAAAPVRRYVVAAVDPAYGRALTITVLEPDYREELRRFISVDELNSYVLAEEDLQKMPRLWQQPFASVQVAASNEAGQSQWAALSVPLTAGMMATAPLARVTRAFSTNAGYGGGAAGPPADAFLADEQNFSLQLQRRRGPDLRLWLEKQKKAVLQAWLKSVNAFSLGTKDELVDSIIGVIEHPSRKQKR